MNFAIFLIPLLAGGASADHLLENPDGVFGYTWGMNLQEAAKVRSEKFECERAGGANTCTALFSSGEEKSWSRQNVRRGYLRLVFDADKLAGIVTVKESLDPADMIVRLHNLLGQPSHQISVPKSLGVGDTEMYSWIREKTSVILKISSTDRPFVIVSIEAWQTSHYLKRINVLPD
jgi:hypothetical protein